MGNLYNAWTLVRRNVLASGRDHFKSEVRRISDDPLPYLRRIQDRLQRGTFVFSLQRGVLKTKRGGKKRPIVVSPIENRIVQRALLNVLQSDELQIVQKLGRIPALLRTPTSVGGIPERGVPEAILQIRRAISAGATHYLRSDIREFFTKVPRQDVIQLVRDETGNNQFADLLDAAMTVELENGEEVKEYLYLFPSEETGVPQGSSLSAFAGNVALEQFDKLTIFVPPCGQSFEINRQFQLYFCPAEWSRRNVRYIGIYKEKSVRYIGEIRHVIRAELNSNGDLTCEDEAGVALKPAQEHVERIKSAMQMTKPIWDVSHGHKFFLCDKLAATDFRKTSPKGIFGHRYLNLGPYLRPGISIEHLADTLKSKTWE